MTEILDGNKPLFAYGTLMFPAIMKSVMGRVPDFRPAAIKGYRRLVVTREVFPGLIAQHESNDWIEGLIYFEITPREWERLLAFEDELYNLERVNVQCCERDVEALAFIVPPGRRSLLSEKSWDPDEFRESLLELWATKAPS
jgi:hypothetical protein